MIIVWLENAQNDLTDYQNHSKFTSYQKIQNYINSLFNYVYCLESFPFLGKNFDYYENIEIRQLLYKKHRIFYYIKNDKIYIIAVIHTSRDINNISKHINKTLNKSEINL